MRELKIFKKVTIKKDNSIYAQYRTTKDTSKVTKKIASEISFKSIVKIFDELENNIIRDDADGSFLWIYGYLKYKNWPLTYDNFLRINEYIPRSGKLLTNHKAMIKKGNKYYNFFTKEFRELTELTKENSTAHLWFCFNIWKKLDSKDILIEVKNIYNLKHT